MKPIAIGTDDFKKIRENDNFFIDKTLFIKELIDDSSDVLLFPRPRRFGKSLNLSMINYYFNIEESSLDLFKGLKILYCGDKYLNEMNKYPVIHFSLKECKTNSYKSFIIKYKELMVKLYKKYLFLLDSPLILNYEKSYFNRILEGIEEDNLTHSLSKLIDMLSTYYKKQVIVLLDEYDAPIMESYLNGYYDELISFLKQIFNSTFKDNLYLKKGIITGILRISKEGMFSDANNIKVYNVCDYRYSTHFGFLESEVKSALSEYNVSGKYEDIKKWYDGYFFGESKIYNPWSILNFLNDPKKSLRKYWVNTGGVDLLRDLIYSKNNVSLLEEYHKLLENGYIEHVNLDLEMILPSLENSKDTVWTLFMLSGYLTMMEYSDSLKDVTLRIPNLEIRENLENICIKWFRDNIKQDTGFEDYLMTNNMFDFKDTLKRIVLESFSYYDVSAKHGENFYHAFVMGLLYSSNPNFDIKSNRESGYGRYDLVLKPKNNSCNFAYIIEFKAIEKDNFEETMEKAFKQIDEKNYIETIKEYDVTKIVIVFKGKEIRIEMRKS